MKGHLKQVCFISSYFNVKKGRKIYAKNFKKKKDTQMYIVYKY